MGLRNEMEKALTDAVYDGSMGTLTDDELEEHIRSLTDTVMEVIEEQAKG